MVTVIKRDKTTEEFHPEKIIKVLIAAGLEENSALLIAQNLNDWAEKQEASTVTSLQIRDEVLSQLKQIDPYVAGLFQWYQNTKSQAAN